MSNTDSNLDDHELKQNAKIFSRLTWGLIIIISLTEIINCITIPKNIPRWIWIAGTFDFVYLSLLWINRRGFFRLASIVLVCFSALMIFQIAWTGGGIRSQIIQSIPIVVLFAGLLLGWRAGIITGVLCSIIGFGLVFTEYLGILPTNHVIHSALSSWISVICNIGIFSLLQYLSVSNLNKALSKGKQELILRKNTETELQMKEVRYRNIFENANDVIFIMKEDRIIDCNTKTLELFGGTRNQIIGQTPYFLSPELQLDGNSSKNKANYLIDQALCGKPQRFEWKHVRFDRTPFDTEVSLNRLEINNEVLIQAIIRDVTERKHAEIALNESEQRFRLIATLSGHVVYEYLIPDDIIIWGGAIEKVTGYLPEEYQHVNFEKWAEMIHPDDRNTTISLFMESLSSFKPFQHQYRFQNKQKEFIWIENESFILTKENNTALKVIGVLKDITQKKELERQIINSVIETEENERLHFSQELHDGLGPLLSATKMYFQWLEMPNANIKRTEIIKDVEKLLDESSRTVREISFKLSPHILLNYGIIEALKTYAAKVKETSRINIDLNFENLCRFDEKAETIVYRVLCECINNTIKHAKAENIKIDMHCHENLLRVEYSDDGIGFDVEKMMNGSKGIGLLNMQSRIKSMNGLISISSTPKIKTCIKFQMNINQKVR